MAPNLFSDRDDVLPWSSRDGVAISTALIMGAIPGFWGWRGLGEQPGFRWHSEWFFHAERLFLSVIGTEEGNSTTCPRGKIGGRLLDGDLFDIWKNQGSCRTCGINYDNLGQVFKQDRIS